MVPWVPNIIRYPTPPPITPPTLTRTPRTTGFAHPPVFGRMQLQTVVFFLCWSFISVSLHRSGFLPCAEFSLFPRVAA